jgi:hypothetical protein
MYTNEIENGENGIIAKIFVNGSRSIEQPFDPNGRPDILWSSVEEAKAWADAYCAALQEQYDYSEVERQRILADSERLQRIEQMLVQLTGQ